MRVFKNRVKTVEKLNSVRLHQGILKKKIFKKLFKKKETVKFHKEQSHVFTESVPELRKMP